MEKISELAKRRGNLLEAKRSLDSKATLESLEGRKYLKCLVMQVVTEIEIEKSRQEGS